RGRGGDAEPCGRRSAAGAHPADDQQRGAEADDQQKPDDPELRERLEEEAVGVADEAAVGAVARPPELEGAGADPGEGGGLVGVDGRLPKLVAARAAEARDLRGAGLRGAGSTAALELI